MTDDQIGDLRSAVYMIADARYIVEAIRDDMKLMGETCRSRLKSSNYAPL